jgi:hypothetical protein
MDLVSNKPDDEASDSTGALQTLERAIAAHLAEWRTAYVELAIHGDADPARIARAIDGVCRRAAGAPVVHGLFYQSSIAAVAGVELAGGRRVVVKGHQPEWAAETVLELARLQRHVAAASRLAPRPIGEPLAFANGLATVEEYDTRGMPADPHDPAIRRAIAEAFHDVLVLLEPFVPASRLPPHLLTAAPHEQLWPRPHSRLFDFETTAADAEDIDALAAEARAAMEPAGRTVLGHGDWRAEHLRFERGRVALAYDWQSVCRCEEPALAGATAHAFCADWSLDGHRQAPTLDGARAFIADYEGARGKPFSRAERRLCGAAFAYSVAYTARCGHAGGFRGRELPGTFHHLIKTHGHGLLAL